LILDSSLPGVHPHKSLLEETKALPVCLAGRQAGKKRGGVTHPPKSPWRGCTLVSRDFSSIVLYELREI